MNEINQQVNTFMNQEDALLDISGTSDEVTTEFTSGDNDYSPSIQLDLFNNNQSKSR